MITEYELPCSSCGKLLKRRVFCSGKCRTRASRDKEVKAVVVDSKATEVSQPHAESVELPAPKPADPILKTLWYEDPDVKSVLPQRCQLCGQMKKNVVKLKLMADGETVVKDVCGECVRKIPEDARI